MLPSDPEMLLSYINMKLRDSYDSLESLCDDLDADKDEIERILAGNGYHYKEENNQFG